MRQPVPSKEGNGGGRGELRFRGSVAMWIRREGGRVEHLPPLFALGNWNVQRMNKMSPGSGL